MFSIKSPVILERIFKPGMVAHACNLNSWETEAEGIFESLRPPWAAECTPVGLD